MSATCKNAINAVETTNAAAATAKSAIASSTGALTEAFQRATNLSHKLNSIVKIKYTDNPGKLAAYIVASHLERQARPNKAETPNKPANPTK